MEVIEEWLVVDGYNVIGAMEKQASLEEARSYLIRLLSEYQAITGRKVFLVFDAHRTRTGRIKKKEEQITVVYTKRKETADQWIESFVRRYQHPNRRIYVATSDYLEQRMVFGQGAYRISSRELWQEIKMAKEKIKRQIRQKRDFAAKYTLGERLSDEVRHKLEKWRRKK